MPTLASDGASWKSFGGGDVMQGLATRYSPISKSQAAALRRSDGEHCCDPCLSGTAAARTGRKRIPTAIEDELVRTVGLITWIALVDLWIRESGRRAGYRRWTEVRCPDRCQPAAARGR